MLKAKDIMNRNVVTVTKDTSVEELGRLFIEKNISGAPVLDEENNIFGIVTENDLINQNKRIHIPTMLRLFDAFIHWEDPEALKRKYDGCLPLRPQKYAQGMW
jgi:CBS-domain-containing membrane protein